MRYSEFDLRGRCPLIFRNSQIADIERFDSENRIDSARLCFINNVCIDLEKVVDVGEALDAPRVFTVEGEPNDSFLMFGSEVVYWLSINGGHRNVLKLYREYQFAEYWKTQFVDNDLGLFIVYEAGVLLVDRSLQVRWHVPKYFNDELVGVEPGRLWFLQDHDIKWAMRMQDGEKVGI
jgi:hypothetical protein